MTARRILMVGASSTRICGVRDHARILERALEELGQEVATLWWERSPSQGVAAALSEARTWASEIARSVRDWDPDCILWHYSVFTYGHRGVPLLVPPLARRLGAGGTPLVAVLHEFAYSFGRRRWRGAVLALTQRAALFALLRRCRALVVTTEERGRWFLARPWLPRRPVAFVPVCSNIPPGAGARHCPESATLSLGVFGFGAEGLLAEPVVSAVSRLRARGLHATLVLLGSPGSESREGLVWQAAARGAGCADALTFTGILGEEELAETILDLDVVVLPDEGGPTSRKTTLAAALAYGKAVVALDGPHRWEPLVLEQAVVLAPSTGEGLARELGSLLEDRKRRDQQGERAAAFYRRRMASEVIAASILAFLDSIDSAVMGR